MFKQLQSLLTLSLFFSFIILLQYATSSAMFAATPKEASLRGNQVGMPASLSLSCVSNMQVTDYDVPLSCVSGYVYLNGSPVAGATVTVSANGESVVVEVEEDGSGGAAYFMAGLSSEPLEVEPGDEVTMTAEFSGQSKALTFIAQPGSQQVDVVLPQDDATTRWQRVDVQARRGAVMSDDPFAGVLLFGGYGNGTLFGETWQWKGEGWSLVAEEAASPSARAYHAMATDRARERVLLFGGYENGASRLNDTWEWDGSRWIARQPSISPPARSSHALAYDAAREQVLLFGGYDGTTYLADTWLWDGNEWREVSSPLTPSARANHAMAYDALNGQIILFGGYDGVATFDETWHWDGEGWREATPASSPSSRYQHTMTYESASQRVMLCGGSNGSSHLAETWLWDGSNWIASDAEVSPAARGEHAMAYDATRQRMVLFGGETLAYLADTWEWDGNAWLLRDEGIGDLPRVRQGAALSYEGAGQSVLFGGTDGSTWDNGTYRWTGSRWITLTPTTSPSGRIGHELVGNSDGSQHLLFGGVNLGTYLNDTWLWNGSEWQAQPPTSQPSPRAGGGLTYDSAQSQWVLFGGQDANGYLADTWAYDGDAWNQLFPLNSPPAAAYSTLSYDSERGRAVLFGGQNENGYLNQVWEWDGSDWEAVIPDSSPPARARHKAAYDSTGQVMVMAGGIGNATIFNDTWQWDGSSWLQRSTMPSLPARYNFAMTYDAQHKQLLAWGGEDDKALVEGTYLHEVLGSPSDAPPIATINYINPRDVRQGSDSMRFAGSGADADGSDIIQAYRWRLNDEVISTQASFILEANTLYDFPLGSQTISLQVQDDEGTWSEIVEQNIFIRDSEADMAGDDSWTLLIYAVGDNNLDAWMGDYANSDGMLYRLRTAGAQANVQVGILYDGAEIGDSALYTLTEDGTWTEEAWSEDEARMDDAETLRDFIAWGYERFESDYYALSLVDHASGVVGLGLDESTDASGNAFLTPLELRTAIQAATNDGSRKLEVLQYDGHSFGLLEDAAIGRGLAHYIVTSPNTSWSIYAYEQYRQLAGSASSPKAYALAVAERYAQHVGSYNLPYTISVFDMARFEAVNSAVSSLGDTLLDYRNQEPQAHTSELRAIRDASQKYDSGGELALTIDSADSYVDIVDFASKLQAQIDDTSVIQAASAANNTIAGSKPFVLYESHQSGEFYYYDSLTEQSQPITVSLENAHGIGIFYPLGISTDIDSAFQQYVRNRLFDTTRNSGWTRFLAQGMPPALGDPPPMPSDLLIPPLLPEEPQMTYHLYLPSVVR